MIQQITVSHVTFVSDRSFDEVLKAFHEQVGSLEEMGWSAIPAASQDTADLERRVQKVLGPSGFTRFLTIDHGKWVSMRGTPTKFIQYTLGNPMIAITMMKHHIEAGLDVPVRLAIYEHPDGKVRLVFNTPSSLMSGLGNDDVQAAAHKLDAKMMALGEAITGAKA
jgi:uncharacterized protein (DUF302 family)